MGDFKQIILEMRMRYKEDRTVRERGLRAGLAAIVVFGLACRLTRRVRRQANSVAGALEPVPGGRWLARSSSEGW